MGMTYSAGWIWRFVSHVLWLQFLLKSVWICFLFIGNNYLERAWDCFCNFILNMLVETRKVMVKYRKIMKFKKMISAGKTHYSFGSCWYVKVDMNIVLGNLISNTTITDKWPWFFYMGVRQWGFFTIYVLFSLIKETFNLKISESKQFVNNLVWWFTEIWLEVKVDVEIHKSFSNFSIMF